jgi:hypothetical protein
LRCRAGSTARPTASTVAATKLSTPISMWVILVQAYFLCIRAYDNRPRAAKGSQEGKGWLFAHSERGLSEAGSDYNNTHYCNDDGLPQARFFTLFFWTKSMDPVGKPRPFDFADRRRLSDRSAGAQFATFDFTPFQAVSSSVPSDSKPHRSKSSSMSPQPTAPSFTPKQGQYLAFIYAYTRVLGRPPAEADLQRHFGVSPPRFTKWCSPSNERS